MVVTLIMIHNCNAQSHYIGREPIRREAPKVCSDRDKSKCLGHPVNIPERPCTKENRCKRD